MNESEVQIMREAYAQGAKRPSPSALEQDPSLALRHFDPVLGAQVLAITEAHNRGCEIGAAIAGVSVHVYKGQLSQAALEVIQARLGVTDEMVDEYLRQIRRLLTNEDSD